VNALVIVLINWINGRCPPKLLYHSPSSTGQGRGSMMKGSWVEIRTGRDHSPITVMGQTDGTWGEKKKFYFSPIKLEKDNEKSN